jgi:hypothetical protein
LVGDEFQFCLYDQMLHIPREIRPTLARRASEGVSPSLASFDVAYSPTPRRGNHISAQGNALGIASEKHV